MSFFWDRSRSFTNLSWKCVLTGNFSLWNSTQLGVKAGEALISPIVSHKMKNFGFDQIDGKAAERIFYLNWNNFILLLSFPTGCRGISFTEDRKWLLWKTLLLDSPKLWLPLSKAQTPGHTHSFQMNKWFIWKVYFISTARDPSIILIVL